MRKHRVTIRACVFTASAWLCSACAPPAQTTQTAVAAAHAAVDAAPHKHPSDFTSPGKPTAPIAIEYELSADPQIGQSIEVQITARVAVGGAAMTLQLQAPDSLLIGAFAPAGRAGDEPGERIFTVTVTALQDVQASVNVTVSAQIDGQEQARSLMIPIRTAAAKAAAGSAAPAKSDAAPDTGEALILLPADETR